MAIAHDAESNVAAGTGTLSWTHTPTGTPRGVWVGIIQTQGLGDEVTGVTYGGVAMTRVPTDGFLSHNPTGTADDGCVYQYWLGASIPTGAQTVEVSVDGTGSSKRAAAATMTASADVEIEDSNQDDQTATGLPSIAMTTGASVETMCYGACIFGQPGVGDLGPGAGMTDILEHDFGSHIGSWTRLTATDAGGGFTFAWALTGGGVNDDYGILATAFKEGAGGGATHFGAADVPLVLGMDAAGFAVKGAASVTPLVLGVDAAGFAVKTAASVTPLVLGIDAAGFAVKTAASITPLVVGIDAAGFAIKRTAAELPIVFGIDSAGDIVGITKFGAAELALVLGIDAAGFALKRGAAVVPLVLGVDGVARVGAFGSAVVPIVLTIDSAGNILGASTVGHFDPPSPAGGFDPGSPGSGAFDFPSPAQGI